MNNLHMPRLLLLFPFAKTGMQSTQAASAVHRLNLLSLEIEKNRQCILFCKNMDRPEFLRSQTLVAPLLGTNCMSVPAQLQIQTILK